MKREGMKIAVVAFLLVMIGAAMCLGQTSDDPYGNDFDHMLAYSGPALTEFADPFPRMRTTAEPLQIVIDNSHGNVADCQWNTYTAKKINVWTGNSEAILENIIIELLPGASIGNIRMIQGRTLDGQNFPSGDVNFTIRKFIIRGGFSTNLGLQEKNEALADAAGWGANAITTVTNACGTLTLEDGVFENCGNSAVAGSWDRVVIKNVRFEKVAKHCLGLREHGKSQVEINGVSCVDCGNSIDFHGNDGPRLTNPDTALVDNLEVIRPTGRSKVSGANWHIVGKNWVFRQDSVVNFNLWPGFDLARNPRHFEVDGYTAINFPTMGFGTLTASTTGGTIKLDHVYVTNSLSGCKIQQTVQMISNSVFTGIHHRYRSGGPQAQENNDDQMLGSHLSWASVYDDINLLYDSKGWARPTYWLPSQVRVLMVTD